MKNSIYFILFIFLLTACGQEVDPQLLKATKQVERFSDDTASIETVNIGGVKIVSTNSDLLHYRNGDPIPLARNAEEWKQYTNTRTGCAAYVNFDSTSIYGLVYSGYVLADDREIAPEGFHVSSRKDWEQIEEELRIRGDTIAGLKSTAYWEEPGTNSTGFDALPTGYFVDKEWSQTNESTNFWTNEPEPSGNDKQYYFFYMLNEHKLWEWYDHNMYGYCIRFVKD